VLLRVATDARIEPRSAAGHGSGRGDQIVRGAVLEDEAGRVVLRPPMTAPAPTLTSFFGAAPEH
jgi:hypothetical protein